MKKELDETLCAKYPEIFADRTGNMQTTAMCWGFECGDGWYDLIDHLCGEIQHHLKHNANPDTAQFVASQVKEKFGTLRFYGSGGDDKIDAFIWFAESFSGKICETCGKPGKRRGGGWMDTLEPVLGQLSRHKPGKRRGGGWIYTACDEHTKDSDLDETDEPNLF